jgi:hypothetical protein
VTLQGGIARRACDTTGAVFDAVRPRFVLKMTGVQSDNHAALSQRLPRFIGKEPRWHTHAYTMNKASTSAQFYTPAQARLTSCSKTESQVSREEGGGRGEEGEDSTPHT